LVLPSIAVAFARWDPLRDLLAIQHRLERLASTGPQGWAPAVDLCETADTFIVTAELPGLTREQIRIEVQDGRLTLQGRRDARVPCEQYHQVERGHGEFSRTFSLPPTVQVEGIAADLRDGVLTITIPKVPEQGPRRVDVS
jgi:HSP20 family protein